MRRIRFYRRRKYGELPPIRPAIVTAEFSESGQYKIKVVENIEVLLAGIGPEHDDTQDAPEARVYTELRALEANAIEERFRAFAPRWLEGIEIEFDGIRGQPQLDRLDIPEPGNTALPRRTTIYLTGQTTQGTPAFTGDTPPPSVPAFSACNAPTETK